MFRRLIEEDRPQAAACSPPARRRTGHSPDWPAALAGRAPPWNCGDSGRAKISTTSKSERHDAADIRRCPASPSVGRICAAIWPAKKPPMVLPVNMNMTTEARQAVRRVVGGERHRRRHGAADADAGEEAQRHQDLQGRAPRPRAARTAPNSATESSSTGLRPKRSAIGPAPMAPTMMPTLERAKAWVKAAGGIDQALVSEGTASPMAERS